MSKHLPKPATAIALVALFVALAGTSYAAFSLPKNSVGTKQLKNNAVTSSKIKNGAVFGPKLDLNGVIAPNASHAITANSADNATNAANATNAGNASNLGGQSASAYGPVASIVMNADGSVKSESAEVASVGHPATGIYCIGLLFTPSGGTANYTGSATIPGPHIAVTPGGGCAGAGAKTVEVEVLDNAGTATSDQPWTGVFR